MPYCRCGDEFPKPGRGLASTAASMRQGEAATESPAAPDDPPISHKSATPIWARSRPMQRQRLLEGSAKTLGWKTVLL